MKKLMAMLLALAMVLSMAACAAPSETAETQTATEATEETTATATETTDKPFDGTTITVVTTSSGPITAVQNNLDEFEAATGITVNMELYEFQEAIDKININAAAGGSDVDVICYRPIQETTTWYNNGYFKTLNDYIAAADDYDYEDFFPSARQVTTVDGNIVGIPYLVEGEMLWYNKKLFEEYGVSVPTNFDELLAAAQALYDPDNNVYGISLRGEGNSAVTQFSGFLYGFGGDFFDDDMNATMNTPEALAALEYYADLVALGPDGQAASSGTADGINWFNNEITAMRIDAYSQTFNHNDPDTALVAENLGYAAFPAGVNGEATPYNIVAWAWGISSTSEHQDAAWEFIKWASSKEMEVQSMLQNGFSARTSAWQDERVAAVVDPELMAVVEETGEVGYPYDRPHNANSSEVRAIVGQMIDLANSGLRGDELAAAVEPLNQQIQEILDSEK
ncbi:MAG TPA: sugar ABC transporter substrate-binding protein [Eubacteriales bacterium]|nr:sugar ABC transporter substrate-binding protein [Eubacteriales bacterium]